MKKKGIEEKPHLKKIHRVSPGSWVDQVWSGRCPDRSFDKPKTIQLPG
jgi:hypothetical protein